MNYNEAIADYGYAIKLNKDYDEAFKNRGECYQILDRFREAEKDYAKVVDMAPQHIVVLFNLALCLEELGEKEKAQENLDEGIRVFESETDADLK